MQRTKEAPAGARRGDKANGPASPVVEELRRRAGDELIQIEETAELTKLSVPTLRWLRHQGEGPPMFKLHRRLVVWRGDVLQWIAEQAAKDTETRAS